MLITHDLGVVAEIAERVIVMYAGRKVEEAPVDELFRDAARIPTRKACSARCRSSAPRSPASETRLAEIPGLVPSLKQQHRGLRLRRPLPARRPDLCRTGRARARGEGAAVTSRPATMRAEGRCVAA